MHKNSLKSTIGGRTTAKKKTAFNYKETSLNNSSVKTHNKPFTSSKFGYDENIFDTTGKAPIAPVPFNLDSGLPDSSSTGSNGFYPKSHQKVRPTGFKVQDKEFTIRKKKSRKEVEFLIGSRGLSENQTLQASNSKKEHERRETPTRNKESRETTGHSLSRISSRE